TRFLEQALHFVEAGVEPDEITGHAAFPDIGGRAQFVLVAEDDVVLPTGEEGRVYVDEVDALRGKLAHDVKIVAPKETVWFELRVAEGDALDHLERQHDLGKQLAEA